MTTKRYAGVVLDPGHGGLDPSKAVMQETWDLGTSSDMLRAYAVKGHSVFDATGGAYTTPGKRYVHEPSGYIYYEGVGNRLQSSYLSTMLIGAGFRVFSTLHQREIIGGVGSDWPLASLDGSWWPYEDVSLKNRVDYANQVHSNLMRETGLGALTVSVHGNAIGNNSKGPSQSARGMSVFTSIGQTSSDPIADAVWRSFKNRENMAYHLRARTPDWSDDDADHEADFYVLKRTAGPAILTEAGFFTNLADAKLMASPIGSQNIARSIFLGIRDFLAPRSTQS